MVFDLTFEEAMDILENRIGLVQGENFDKHEYLSLDRKSNVIVKNAVGDQQLLIWDGYGKETKEFWPDKKFIPDEVKNQKYRFILVLNEDSVKGICAFSWGNDRDSYLRYKAVNKGRGRARC